MLILKQNSANSVPTPPAGKGTIFLDDSDTLSVKTSDGNVETFPTVAAANTQVVFIDGTSLSGNANFTYNKNTDTLSLTGTVSAGNVKTNNLLYANGTPWDLSDPGGSNTEIQFNDDESFGGSAAFTFNKSSNLVTVAANLNSNNLNATTHITAGNVWANSGTISAQTLKGEAGNLSNITAGNITGQVANALVAGTVYTAAQPNITSVGTLTSVSVTGNANVGNLGTGGLIVATGNITGGNLITTGSGNVGELNVSGNAVITGNLAVNGNVTYVNVDTLQVEDPVISLGGGPNGAPLTTNDGKDRGTLLNYYTTSAIDAFMGWDNSNGEFAFGSNVSIVNDVITFNTLGNVRVGNIIGNGQALTGITGANVTGQVANALVAGTVYTAAQPNITSVGTLTSLGVSGNLTAPNIIANTGAFYGNAAGLTNIPGANITGSITGNISNANYAAFAGQVVDSTQSNITSVGKLTSLLAGSDATAGNFANATVIAAAGDSGATDSSKAGLVGEALASGVDAVGLFGVAKANGTYKGTGVQGTATVNASADTGSAVGVRGISATTHSGGYNIGVLGNAAGSGVGNYAFYVQAGDIASIEANTVWDLYDNSATALSLNSSGKAGILAVSTADSAEGVTMSGTLSVTGNATVGGIKTDNFYYSNGTPVDFQQTGGTNTDIQFNDGGNFGGSNAFTFNKTSNVVTISGNLSVANVQATGDLVGATLTSNGNANVGNLGTAGLITATGNVSGGNLTTTGVVSATGNVSGGNLTTTGALSVTGNANVGNIGATHLVVTGNVTGNLLPSANVTYDLGSETQRWRDLYLAGNTIVLGSQTINSTATSTQLSGVLNANGSGLFALNASNLSSGTVPTGRLSGNYTMNVLGWANTVADNAQPNITSVGTLTSLAVTGNATAGNVYANSGTVGASLLTGTLTTAAQPNITSVGTLSSLTVTGNVTGGNLNTAGKVVASTLESNVATGTAPFTVASTTKVANLNADLLDGLSTATAATGDTVVIRDTNGSFSANVVTANLSGNATTAGTVVTAAQPNITSVGTLTSLSVTGNGTFGNVYANTGTIGALTLKGEGGNISNITAGNITGQVANALVAGTVYTAAQPNITSVGTLSSLAVTGNATAGNVYANSGTIGASLLTGTLTTAAQPNITSVGTLSSLAVTGNVAAGNLTTTGVLSVTGTGVSSIAGNLDMTSNNIINLAAPVNANDAATKQYVDDVAQGLHTHDTCNAATTDTLAVLSGGTVTYNNGSSGVGATLTTTGSYTTIDGVTLSNGMRILVKNEANSAHNGIYDRTSSTVLTRSSDFDTPTEMAGGDFTFVTAGTLYDNTGWVMTDPVTTVGTSPVPWVQFSGAGTYTAGTGLTLTGTVFSVNASQTQITSVGTLTGLAVNGNITAANITANTGVFTGNGSGLSALAGGNVTGQVANALVAGTVYTAAQPNITSVGTLTSLSVTGNVSAGNVSGTLLTGTLTTAAQPNITSVGTLTSLGVSGNITAANITANTGIFSGNGSGLSAIAGANVTGTVSSATTAGTVTTAAQPNITSVGTLTSLGVNGTVTAVAFTANTGVFTGNGSGLSAIAGANVTGQVANALVAGTVYTAAQPNITSVGTLTSLTVTGNASAGNISTGGVLSVTGNANVGNIGAAAGVFTSVSGNGSALTALNASNISTGTLAQARLANSSLTVNGTAISLGGSGTITANTTQTLTLGSFLTGTSFNGGTAVTAAVDATSAATASKVVSRDTNGSFSANVITANSFAGAATTAGTVTTAAQPNITSVGQLTSLTVSGNITANNFICNGFFDASINAAVSAAGTVQGNATALTTEINVTTTVASGAGVALPTAVAGIRVTLINTAANALLVYPASGGQINSLGTNASYSLPANGRLEFVATSTTQWYTMGAAYS